MNLALPGQNYVSGWSVRNHEIEAAAGIKELNERHLKYVSILVEIFGMLACIQSEYAVKISALADNYF